MRKFSLITMLLLTLALMVSGPLFAQDLDLVPCGDLSEADCDILKQSAVVNNALSSATSQFNISMVLENIPDLPFENLSFTLNGNANFSADPVLLAELAALQTAGDPTAMMTYFQDPTVLAGFVKGFNGEVDFTLTLPQDLVNLFASSSSQIPSEISLEARLVDGVGYVNLDGIASAMPQAGMPGGWLGFDVARALELAIEQGEFDAVLEQSYASQPQLDVSDYEEIYNYMTIQRLADSTVNGNAVAVFETVIDYEGLFGSDFMNDVMAAEGELTEAELAEIEEILATTAQGIEFATTQYIGLNDYYVYRTEVTFDFDMTGLLESVGETIPGGQAPVLKFTVDIQSGDFNTAPAIVAPEGAQLYPVEAMFSNS